MKALKALAAITFISGSWMPPQLAHASEYGCKVLLCLANPGGPKQYSECVPPINQLWNDLSHGDPFPTCDLSDGNSPGNYAQQINNPYDPCPAGLAPAPQGTLLIQGVQQPKPKAWSIGYTVTGEPGISESLNEDGKISGPQACVGNLLGSYLMGSQDDGTMVTVYDKVVWQPYKSPRAIDIYVNNKLQTRVHW